MTRFIFITGGVVSSLGKGLASAALGALLQARGYQVRLRKLDPYLNVDPGTMSPYQHGEVFVTDDGAETDLDLGHYERFTGVSARQARQRHHRPHLFRRDRRERRGDYLGATVQVIPHVTDAIKEFVQADITDDRFRAGRDRRHGRRHRSLPFLEAIRQLGNELGPERAVRAPDAGAVSSRRRRAEDQADPAFGEGAAESSASSRTMLLCRCDMPIPPASAQDRAVLQRAAERGDPGARRRHDLPGADRLSRAGLRREVLRHFGSTRRRRTCRAGAASSIVRNPEGEVRIAVVGKYTNLLDSYKSLAEALTHGGIANNVKVKLRWVDSEIFEHATTRCHPSSGGVTASWCRAASASAAPRARSSGEFARERKVPFFGICFGMQMAVIEAARNLAGLPHASSTEFGPCDGAGGRPDDRMDARQRAGAARAERSATWAARCGWAPIRQRDLAGRRATSAQGAAARDLWRRRGVLPEIIEFPSATAIRYEVNVNYRDRGWRAAGLRFSGLSPGRRAARDGVEIHRDHPWFVGVQFHPELKGSEPFAPHPAVHRRHHITPAKSSTAAAIRPSRSTSPWKTAPSAAPPCRRAPRPARTRRSSCATATRRAMAARAC
jgi:CTP synthase